MKHMGNIGLLKTGDTPEQVAAKSRTFFSVFFAAVATVMVFSYMVSAGILSLTLTQIATYLGYSVLLLVAGYFIYVWTAGAYGGREQKDGCHLLALLTDCCLLVRLRASRDFAEPVRS